MASGLRRRGGGRKVPSEIRESPYSFLFADLLVVSDRYETGSRSLRFRTEPPMTPRLLPLSLIILLMAPLAARARCTPTTCAAQGKNCGTIPNGCRGTLTCGACTAPQTCGGGGIANVCGLGTPPPACTPTTCAAQGKNCGTIPDGCGGTLTCGACTAPQTCGSGGIAHICGLGKPPPPPSPLSTATHL